MARRRSKQRRGRGSRLPWRWILGLGVLALIAYCWSSPPRVVRQWWSEHQGLVRVEGHAETILAAAQGSGVDPNLLAGVMMVESRGRVDAQSPAGALGLFQLMLPTAVERAKRLKLPEPSKRELLRDANLNARLGADYLAWLLRYFEGEEEQALIAYNAGPGRLRRWIAEAGSYAAWRDARERAGNSDVLAYARNVQSYRKRFADRGAIAPTAVLADPSAPPRPLPSATLEDPLAAGGIGPHLPIPRQ